MDVPGTTPNPASSAAGAAAASSSSSHVSAQKSLAQSSPVRQRQTELEAKITTLSREIQGLKDQVPSRWSFSSLRSSGSGQKKEKKRLQAEILQKEQELTSLKNSKEKNEAIITLFNNPKLRVETASLVRSVYEENSSLLVSRPPVMVGSLAVPYQTYLDIIERVYELTINGRAFGKEDAIAKLIEQVDAETAKKIVCITNQQLIISLVPIDTRYPEVYNELKSQGLRPVAAKEFLPLFKIDIDKGEVTLTVQAHIWIQNRDNEQNVVLITANLTIADAKLLPDGPMLVEYRLY